MAIADLLTHIYNRYQSTKMPKHKTRAAIQNEQSDFHKAQAFQYFHVSLHCSQGERVHLLI